MFTLPGARRLRASGGLRAIGSIENEGLHEFPSNCEPAIRHRRAKRQKTHEPRLVVGARFVHSRRGSLLPVARPVAGTAGEVESGRRQDGGARGAGGDYAGETRRHGHFPGRVRLCAGVEHGDDPVARGRATRQSGVHGRPTGEGGRPAGAARPAPVRRPTRAGRRADGARPGAAQKRQHRPRTLQGLVWSGLDSEAAVRHAIGAGESV